MLIMVEGHAINPELVAYIEPSEIEGCKLHFSAPENHYIKFNKASVRKIMSILNGSGAF